jgi:hypothetical protein
MAEENCITIPCKNEKPVGRIKTLQGTFQSFKVQDNNLFLSFLFADESITFKLEQQSVKQIISTDFTQPSGSIFLFEGEEYREFRNDVGYGKSRYPFPVSCVCSAYLTNLGLIPSCVTELLKDTEFQKSLPEDFKAEQPKPVAQKEEKPTVKTSVQPDKAKDTVDIKQKEIDALKRQLSQAEEKLDNANDLIKTLKDKSEETIEDRDITDFFADENLDDECEKKTLEGFLEDTVFQQDYEKDRKKSYFEVNKKNVKNTLWEIVKEDKKLSEETLKNLIITLKWEIIEHAIETDLAEARLLKSEEQNKKLSDDIVVLTKEKETLEKDLKSSRQMIAKQNEQPNWEEMQELIQQPKKYGHRLSESQHAVLKYLVDAGQADWKMLNDNLIKGGKFRSLSTLSVALNGLMFTMKFVVKEGKFYKPTKEGKDCLASWEGTN